MGPDDYASIVTEEEIEQAIEAQYIVLGASEDADEDVPEEPPTFAEMWAAFDAQIQAGPFGRERDPRVWREPTGRD